MDEYTLANIGICPEQTTPGTQLWGSCQIQEGVGGVDAATVLGLNQRRHLGALTLNEMFGRKEGVECSPLLSSVRALPLGSSTDATACWAAGLGMALAPVGRLQRLTVRLEWKEGDAETSRLASPAGDVTFAGSLAPSRAL